MTVLAMVRHGETDWNRRGLIQGTTDVPLNETGTAQAMEVAQELIAHHSKSKWSGVVTSPLSRAFATGQMIADTLNTPMLEPIAQFTERDYGSMEGIEMTRARELYPSGEYPESESKDEVLKRARTAIEDLRATHAQSALVVVSHGGLLHALLSNLHGARLPSIQNAAVNLIEYGDNGWAVKVINNEYLSASLA